MLACDQSLTLPRSLEASVAAPRSTCAAAVQLKAAERTDWNPTLARAMTFFSNNAADLLSWPWVPSDAAQLYPLALLREGATDRLVCWGQQDNDARLVVGICLGDGKNRVWCAKTLVPTKGGFRLNRPALNKLKVNGFCSPDVWNKLKAPAQEMLQKEDADVAKTRTQELRQQLDALQTSAPRQLRDRPEPAPRACPRACP